MQQKSTNGKRLGQIVFLVICGLIALVVLNISQQYNHHVSVVKVSHLVQIGDRLTDSDIAPYELSGETLPPGTISWDNRALVTDHITRDNLYPDELVRSERLMSPDGKGPMTRMADLIAKKEDVLDCIPVGAKDPVISLGIQPGDYLDVSGTFNSVKPKTSTTISSAGTGVIETMSSVVIAQHARVLKLGPDCILVEVSKLMDPNINFQKKYGQLSVSLARPDEQLVDVPPLTSEGFMTINHIPTDQVPLKPDQQVQGVVPFSPQETPVIGKK